MALTQEISTLPKTLAAFMLWEPEDGYNGAAAARARNGAPHGRPRVPVRYRARAV